MKKILSLLLIAMLFNCSNKKSTEQQNETPNTSEAHENQMYHLAFDKQAVFKEKLFFHFREAYLDVNNEYLLVTNEDLNIDHSDNSFSYVLIVCDVLSGDMDKSGLLIHYVEAERKIFIKGSFKFDNLAPELNRYDDVKIMLNFTLEKEGGAPNPYGDQKPEKSTENMETYIAMDLQTPYPYNRNEMYLKSRINKLTRDELAGYNVDELSILRNEIFARHGHIFKTDKMKQHFGTQPWYKSVFDDATQYLNNTEKENIRLIKSLEEQIS